jgi:CxxC motif-containing protein
VDEEQDYAVTGHGCQRGIAYGKKELINPTRVITSTVKIKGADYRRCPVKTNRDIPKGLIADAMALLNGVEIQAPVHCGDLVISNICGTGVDFVVTRDM